MDKLLEKRNVIGFSENKDTVEVFVTKKYSDATAQRLINTPKVDFWEQDLVPKFITRFFKKKKCNVVEVGEVKALKDFNVSPDRTKRRPMKGGCEIGIKNDIYVGTAGGVVYRRKYRGLKLYGVFDSFLEWIRRYGLDYDEEQYILTNTHVAVKNVFNPEQYEYYQPLKGTKIGEYNESVPLFSNKNNYLDAAIIKVDNGDILAEQIPGWKITGINRTVRASDELKKYGRTTRETHGTLTNSKVTISVKYNHGNALFRDVYQVSDMSAGGDSGSMVLNQNNEVVGLVFAGGGDYSYVIPIGPIVDHFQLSTIYN